MPTVLPRPVIKGFNPANTSGCVLYLPLWKTSLQGSSIRSPDKYGHLCTVIGTVYGSQGRTYDGDDEITGSDAAFPAGASDRTVLMWVKPDGLKDYQAFFHYGTNTAHDAFSFTSHFGANTDRLYVGIYLKNAIAASDAGAIVAGEWALIGLSLESGTDVVYYKNGIAIGSTVIADSTVATTILSSFTIGDSWNVGDTFDGIIGEVMLYSRILTQGDVMRVYQATIWRYL